MQPGRWNLQIFASTNYAASVQKQREEFTSRFPEFRRNKDKVKLLAHPFDLPVEDSPDDCQMELIELQAGMNIKGDILEIDWWTVTNTTFAESHNIFPKMLEKLSPSLAEPTAVSNSIKMKLTEIR